MRALLDRMHEMAMDRVAVPPSEWREYLRQSSERVLDVFLEYPLVAIEAMRLGAGGPSELMVLDRTLEAITAAGVSDDRLVRYCGLLGGINMAFCAGLASARRSAVDNGLYSGFWIDRPLNVTASTHPFINAQRDELAALRDRDIFRDAISLVIQEIARETSHAD